MNAFEDGSDPLSAADAHRDQRIAAVDAAQLVQRFYGDDGAGSSQRMTERNTAAIGIGSFGWKVEFAPDGKELSGECLVQLNDIHLLRAQAGALEQFLNGGDGANAHNGRLHADDSVI